MGIQTLAGALQRDRYIKNEQVVKARTGKCVMLKALLCGLSVISKGRPGSTSRLGSTGRLRSTLERHQATSPAKVVSPLLVKHIAKVLLRTIHSELEIYGLMTDFVGYAYRSQYKDSAWDFRQDDGRLCIMGHHQDLFSDALLLLADNLSADGLKVRQLTFRQEKIQFPSRVKRKYIRTGLGLSWQLE